MNRPILISFHMTQEQYEKSIQTGYLQLTNWQKFNHFSIVGFLLFIPLGYLSITLYERVNGNGSNFNSDELYIIFIPVILATLFYFLQKSRLKFKVLISELKREQIIDYLEQLCKEWNWTIKTNNHSEFLAKTNPTFFSGSWGEQVTILFIDNKILLNSICDLDKRSSLVSMGHNRENVQAVTDLINNANNLTLS